jgi:hypothetical protein
MAERWELIDHSRGLRRSTATPFRQLQCIQAAPDFFLIGCDGGFPFYKLGGFS